MHALFAALGVCCGAAALIVVCIWAQDPNQGDSGYSYYGGNSLDTYLGKPSWENDYFPSYHPVLMVSGFYFAQILGICMWSFIPEHNIAKTMHVMFMLGAIGCMIAALYAVVNYEQYLYLPSLTSMHSWVGVMTITMFGTQFIFGMIMGSMSAAGGGSPMMTAMHRASGIMSLFLTTVSILTGIQNYLFGPVGVNNLGMSPGTCGYSVSGNEHFDKNPGAYYLKLRPGCRLGFGLGVLCCLGTIFTALAAYSRNLTLDAEQVPQGESGQPAKNARAPEYEMAENK